MTVKSYTPVNDSPLRDAVDYLIGLRDGEEDELGENIRIVLDSLLKMNNALFHVLDELGECAWRDEDNKVHFNSLDGDHVELLFRICNELHDGNVDQLDASCF